MRSFHFFLSIRRSLSVGCILATLPSYLFAADPKPADGANAPNSSASLPAPRSGYDPVAFRMTPRWWQFQKNYTGIRVPENDFRNTSRLDQLMRSGNIYLSLQDAIALSLENNLDVQNQRLGASIAQANLLRAQAGGALRGTTPGIQASPTSATSTTATGASQSASSLATTATTSSTGAIVQQTGTAIPNYDPVLTGVASFGHTTTLQYNSVVAGNLSSVVGAKTGTAQVSEGFSTGTTVAVGYNDVIRSSNSFTDAFNPARTASLTFRLTQNLLQGFGRAVNNRNIEVARNNIEGADLTFKLQVITTVEGIMNLYWDLVAFNDDVRAKEQALATNQKLFNDNKRQVEVGTLAPIAVIQAEAAVASSQQDLILSETRVLQQETIIKNYLTRDGITTPTVLDAHIIPTDHIELPRVEQVQPMQDMIAQALSSRPEMASARINLTNSQINLRGSKSELLPSVQVFAQLNNNGLTGIDNTLAIPTSSTYVRKPGDPYFDGGYGTLLGQLFGRNFPDYSAGVQVNIPLRNRAAQADYVIDQLTVRQSEISLRKQENQIRVDVRNALIGLQQSRAVLQASQKARVLQEQTLDAEQKKLNLGVSTIYNVILIQRDLANAQSAEVAALANYAKARVELERSTGQILLNHNVSVAEAYRGRVPNEPSPLPPPK